jgi:hypothetical protein
MPKSVLPPKALSALRFPELENSGNQLLHFQRGVRSGPSLISGRGLKLAENMPGRKGFPDAPQANSARGGQGQLRTPPTDSPQREFPGSLSGHSPLPCAGGWVKPQTARPPGGRAALATRQVPSQAGPRGAGPPPSAPSRASTRGGCRGRLPQWSPRLGQ